jgi:hypothetical protein
MRNDVMQLREQIKELEKEKVKINLENTGYCQKIAQL